MDRIQQALDELEKAWGVSVEWSFNIRKSVEAAFEKGCTDILSHQSMQREKDRFLRLCESFRRTAEYYNLTVTSINTAERVYYTYDLNGNKYPNSIRMWIEDEYYHPIAHVGPMTHFEVEYPFFGKKAYQNEIETALMNLAIPTMEDYRLLYESGFSVVGFEPCCFVRKDPIYGDVTLGVDSMARCFFDSQRMSEHDCYCWLLNSDSDPDYEKNNEGVGYVGPSVKYLIDLWKSFNGVKSELTGREQKTIKKFAYYFFDSNLKKGEMTGWDYLIHRRYFSMDDKEFYTLKTLIKYSGVTRKSYGTTKIALPKYGMVEWSGVSPFRIRRILTYVRLEDFEWLERHHFTPYTADDAEPLTFINKSGSIISKTKITAKNRCFYWRLVTKKGEVVESYGISCLWRELGLLRKKQA